MSTSTKIKMLDHALAYARSGLAIFPLKPRSKTPITKHGVIDATTDEKTIRSWWTRSPDANIGLACGASGIVAIDCDGDRGLETWGEFEIAHGLRYKTRVAITPGKIKKGKHEGRGRHILFKEPSGIKLSNTSGAIAPGIDTRAGNGYILLPPSVHPDHLRGPRYQWENERAPIADMPQALIEVLTRPEAATPAATANTTPQAATIAQGNGQRDLSHYADRAFTDEIATLRAAPEGQRNAQLNRSAFALGQLLGAGQLDRSEVEIALTDAANAIGLANDPNCGPRGIEKTIASGLAAGIATPRDLTKITDRRNGHGPAADDLIDLSLAPDDEHEHAAQPKTDLGNARRFAIQHADQARFVKQWGWHVWTGTHWAEDDTGAIYRLARRTVRSIFGEASNAATDDDAKAIGRWALQSQNKTRLDAMIALAQSEPEIAAKVDYFNHYPMLLPVANGMIDLESGALLPHDPRKLITRYTPIAYDAGAACPQWLHFLDRVMAGNQQTITFLQRAIGYSLTGITNEQCLFNLWGVGANGKTVFTTILSKLLGQFSARAPIEVLLQRKFDANGPTSDLARLAGARVVLSSEVPQNRRLNETLIKDLTGEDEITACFKYREPFQYRPSFKLWLSGNHKPVIRGTDYGIWRRIHLIPFEVVIPVAERDRRLVTKLSAELPGVLAWAIRGCLEWQRIGLQTPDEIEKATAAYKAEMDVIANFITERVMKMDQHDTPARELYAAYKAWCDEAGERAESQRALGLLLAERGFRREHRRDGDYWLKIGLKTG